MQADPAPPTEAAPAATPEPSRTEPDAVHAEWDHRIGRYRPRWCSVYGGAVPPGPAAWPPGTLAPAERALARRLAAIGGPWRRVGGRAVDGDDWHHAALIDSVLDLHGRRTPDPRIHHRLGRATPPLAVLLVLDASASTHRGDEAGVELLARMQRSAATAALALQRLGHRSGLWAFSSQGRHRIDMPCLKHWDQSLPALARLPGGGSTRLGAAVRHALHLCALDARQHPGWRRAVVLLTDGEAHDIDVHDPDYLPADLARAAREARARGVAVRALVFEPGDAGALAASLGPASVRSCAKTSHLPQALKHLLAATVGSRG